MPASHYGLRKSLQVIIFIALLTASLSYVGDVPIVHAGTRTVAINSALKWLIVHQLPDGSYGSLTDHEVAPAANALWIGFRDISNVLLAYNFLKNEMQNVSGPLATWFWGGGGSLAEADIPGEILYSFDMSQHLRMLNLSSVAPKLLSFQQPNGGFKGYFDPRLSQQVTSSVDTAMALWGLINAKAIPASSQTPAINYLFSLQNPDGSFNLTQRVRSDPLYSLGPEPISITALVTLILKDASFTVNDTHVSLALKYLGTAASVNFNSHVYAASFSALAFTFYYNPTLAAKAVNFVLSQQDPSGGFRDTIRFSPADNALDTGWAAIALQLSGLFGDVNLDGVVNFLDLGTLGGSFLTKPGASAWNPHADVNGDGVVNFIDLGIVGSDFLKTADSL